MIQVVIPRQCGDGDDARFPHERTCAQPVRNGLYVQDSCSGGVSLKCSYRKKRTTNSYVISLSNVFVSKNSIYPSYTNTPSANYTTTMQHYRATITKYNRLFYLCIL